MRKPIVFGLLGIAALAAIGGHILFGTYDGIITWSPSIHAIVTAWALESKKYQSSSLQEQNRDEQAYLRTDRDYEKRMRHEGAKVVPVIVDILNAHGETDDYLSDSAIVGLDYAVGEDSVRILSPYVHSGTVRQREAIAAIFHHYLHDQEAVQALELLRKDKDSGVRSMAAYSSIMMR